MKIKQNKHQHSISEICDSIIEVAQTLFVNQTELTEGITLNLSDYTVSYIDDETTKAFNKEIIDYLMSQQIRLYEDSCDENGIITSSKEQYSNIFSSVTLSSDNTNINLHFSNAMIDLLT